MQSLPHHVLGRGRGVSGLNRARLSSPQPTTGSCTDAEEPILGIGRLQFRSLSRRCRQYVEVVADEEAHVLLFEPASTQNTGNLQNERTTANLDRR